MNQGSGVLALANLGRPAPWNRFSFLRKGRVSGARGGLRLRRRGGDLRREKKPAMRSRTAETGARRAWRFCHSPTLTRLDPAWTLLLGPLPHQPFPSPSPEARMVSDGGMQGELEGALGAGAEGLPEGRGRRVAGVEGGVGGAALGLGPGQGLVDVHLRRTHCISFLGRPHARRGRVS